MNIKRIAAIFLTCAMLSLSFLSLSACGEDETVYTEPDAITFEEYIAMSESEQISYYESFSSIDAFFAWYNAAKEEYEKTHTPPELEDNNKPEEDKPSEEKPPEVEGGVSEGDKLPDDDNEDKENSDQEGDGDSGSTEGEGDNPENKPEGDGDSGSTEGEGDNPENKPEGDSDSGSTEGEGDNPENKPEDDGLLTYEEYTALSGEEQAAYYESFASPEDFFAWFNAAKAKYDEENKGLDIGEDGNIDIGG